MRSISAAQAGFILRIVLALTMLSAVADRFGAWGLPGTPGVAWGNWTNFVAYTQQLNSFANHTVAGMLAIIATTLEILLPLLLIVGYQTQKAALAAGMLLLLFALAMAISISVKAPLDYSVLTSAAAAFLLSTISKTTFALDNKLRSA